MGSHIDIEMKDYSGPVLDEVNAAIARALETVGLAAEGYAKRLCPVDTGRLRNSITHALDGEAPATTSYHASYGSNTHTFYDVRAGKQVTRRWRADSKWAGSVSFGRYEGTLPQEPEGQRAIIIGTNVEYAVAIENGHSKQAPQGFLGPAVTNHLDQFKRIIANELSELSN